MDGIEPGEVSSRSHHVPIEDEAKLDRVWEEFERLYYEDDDEDDEDDEDGGHIHSGCCEKETE